MFAFTAMIYKHFRLANGWLFREWKDLERKVCDTDEQMAFNTSRTGIKPGLYHYAHGKNSITECTHYLDRIATIIIIIIIQWHSYSRVSLCRCEIWVWLAVLDWGIWLCKKHGIDAQWQSAFQSKSIVVLYRSWLNSVYQQDLFTCSVQRVRDGRYSFGGWLL